MNDHQAAFTADMTLSHPRAGYRLQRLEIKNFGGYHGPASVFHFDLQGAVFSGDNGAGKSTAIDAYRMLFRTHPRFNSATDGAKDRSVETYYVGQYGKKDGGAGGKAQTLRGYGNKKGFMAICGVFMTDGGEIFSALRMAFYAKQGEAADWRLVTAPSDISIERDFPDWPTKGNCARMAQALGGELHPTYKDFFAAVGAAFGIDDSDESADAFRFIDQSIGVKKLGSIASFARENIFPRNSLRKSADGAITSFEEVQETTRQIERTSAMIAELKDVGRKFGHYENALGAHSETTLRKLHFGQFGHLMNMVRYGRILRRATARHDDIEASLSAAEATMSAAEAELRAIDLKMTESGFDKVDDLKNQQQRLLVSISRLKASLSAVTDTFSSANMPFDASNEAAFLRSFEKVEARIAELDTQISENREGERTADFDLRNAKATCKAAAAALEDILRNKSALDPSLIKARNSIAEELRMRPDEMPFLAELAQVRAEESAWEGVANRVLGGVATQILVETPNLAAVRRFIKGRHFGAKLVFHEVTTLFPEQGRELHRDALAHKIEIKSGDRFEHVARHMVDQTADHICMDAAEFETTSARFAVIKEGAVKNGLKTVKDDRYRIDDRSKYCLGWNVQDHIDLAQARLAEAEAAVSKGQGILDEYGQGLAALSKRRDAATRLLGARQDFSAIDVASATAEYQKVEAEIAALDTHEAEALRERRLNAIRRKAEAAEGRDKLNQQKGSAESTMRSARESLNKAYQRYEEEIQGHGRASFKERRHYLEIMRKLSGAPAGTHVFHHVMVHKEADMDAFIASMRQRIDEVGNSALNIANSGSRARKAAEEFMRRFPEADLSTDVIADDFEKAAQVSRAALVRGEWQSRLEKLERDDLPRHKQAFEERRKTFAIDAVEQIESVANSYARRIKLLEKGFNNILSGLTYDPMEGTRAKLRIHPRTENEAVQRFRGKLKHALSVLYGGDHALIERVVQDLIDEIKVEGDSKSAIERREAILDLRNWFTMDVEEFYVDEGGVYKEQRRIYGGQDGASGGQGERLTMLLIGAAMSYTFGAGDDSRQVTGLQTIMLDEAFMHGSEEMAAAATDVLDAMGLQVVAATPVQKLQAFAGKTERVFSISKRNEQILHTDSTYAALEEMERRVHAGFEARVTEMA